MMQSLYGSLLAQQQQQHQQQPDALLQAAAAAAVASDPVLVSRDTTYTKIFVGGLPYHTSDKTLFDYFAQFGDIEEAVVITDRQTQKSRGYGFVTMKNRDAAERACKDPNPIIDGRKANVNLAYLGAKPRGNIHLAALSAGLQQLPLQSQLQALLPANRLGLQQLYYPTMTNQLVSAGQPTAAMALAGHQQQAGTGLMFPHGAISPLTAATAGHHAGLQPATSMNGAVASTYLDHYAGLTAAQNAAVLQQAAAAAYTTHPNVAVSGAYEQLAYAPYGLVPASYAAQLQQSVQQAMAAQQQQVAGNNDVTCSRI